MVDLDLSAQENAERILDEKYGSGNWDKGPNTEHNKIVKWINRSLKCMWGPDDIDYSGEFYYDDFGNKMYIVKNQNGLIDEYGSSYQIYIIIENKFYRVYE